MNTKAKTAMRERIERHGRNLLTIFPYAKETDPVRLCKALRRIEGKASRYMTDVCNGTIQPGDDEHWAATERILTRVQILLGYQTGDVAVIVNCDPRGYALKIDDAWMREHRPELHRDWGGYGILAPDLTEA